jgi:hypothetical protein
VLCDGSVHDERTTAMNDRSGSWGVAATMTSWSAWGQSSYCWAVICKNVRFHRHANVNSGHKILWARRMPSYLRLLSRACLRPYAMSAVRSAPIELTRCPFLSLSCPTRSFGTHEPGVRHASEETCCEPSSHSPLALCGLAASGVSWSVAKRHPQIHEERHRSKP